MPRGNTAPIGPLMLDVAGLGLSAEDVEVLAHPLVGGVILFSRNYRDREQLDDLCAALALVKTPRLLIAVDHEGGRVQRFREGFTRVPPMRTLGARYETDRPGALTEAEGHGFTIGSELGTFGIDLCFAPVLDRDVGVSGVIGDRAFATDIDAIVDLARAFRTGLNRAGRSATGKHFPGHGAVAADSHHELPEDPRGRKEIEATDLAPFRELIADGIESLMMAHVRYRAVDETPASLSRKWIQGVLRRKLGFKGAVFCDDLSMNGAAAVGSVEERARLALDAGCDMLPVCNDRASAVKVIDALAGTKPSQAGNRRLRALYGRPAAGG